MSRIIINHRIVGKTNWHFVGMYDDIENAVFKVINRLRAESISVSVDLKSMKIEREPSIAYIKDDERHEYQFVKS